MEWLTSLGPYVVPVVAIVVGGAIAIVTMILKHQERIAKIERGIDSRRAAKVVEPCWIS